MFFSSLTQRRIRDKYLAHLGRVNLDSEEKVTLKQIVLEQVAIFQKKQEEVRSVCGAIPGKIQQKLSIKTTFKGSSDAKFPKIFGNPKILV